MKIKIVDYFWAVGHRTKRKGSYKLPMKVGESVKVGYYCFKVDSIEGEEATVSMIREDGTVARTFTVGKEHGAYYRPLSFDAGHEYTAKLTRF